MNKLLFLCLVVWGANVFAQSTPGGRFQSYNYQYLNGPLNAANPTTLPANAVNSLAPPQHFTMGVTTTATGWTVALDGSLDAINWKRILLTNTAVGNVSNITPEPMLYFRMAETGLSGASTVTATAIGVPY